ncbi:MAG: hypothetical protein U0Y68_18380 [Blastocatellia bacterium]
MSTTLTLQTLLDLRAKIDAIPRAPRIVAVEPTPIYAPRKPHHKKRIAKKWLKQHGTKIVGYDRFMGDNVITCKTENVAFCHTDIARRLEFEQRRREREQLGQFGIISPWGFTT